MFELSFSADNSSVLQDEEPEGPSVAVFPETWMTSVKVLCVCAVISSQSLSSVWLMKATHIIINNNKANIN